MTSLFSGSIAYTKLTSVFPINRKRICVFLCHVHPLKTKLMVVGSTYNLNTKSGDLSNNNLVSRVPSYKCLEVLLHEKLTFETHIEYICKKACAGIGALRRISLLSHSAPS